MNNLIISELHYEAIEMTKNHHKEYPNKSQKQLDRYCAQMFAELLQLEVVKDCRDTFVKGNESWNTLNDKFVALAQKEHNDRR